MGLGEQKTFFLALTIHYSTTPLLQYSNTPLTAATDYKTIFERSEFKFKQESCKIFGLKISAYILNS
ncbi:MAG: hypothetical protein BA872_00275 [Desulfobacterales bacterium C00003060]|nr:MAG: hypothetical protein BA872_00275 [Desulfobacterales bacterium C00003060]